MPAFPYFIWCTAEWWSSTIHAAFSVLWSTVCQYRALLPDRERGATGHPPPPPQAGLFHTPAQKPDIHSTRSCQSWDLKKMHRTDGSVCNASYFQGGLWPHCPGVFASATWSTALEAHFCSTCGILYLDKNSDPGNKSRGGGNSGTGSRPIYTGKNLLARPCSIVRPCPLCMCTISGPLKITKRSLSKAPDVHAVHNYLTCYLLCVYSYVNIWFNSFRDPTCSPGRKDAEQL